MRHDHLRLNDNHPPAQRTSIAGAILSGLLWALWALAAIGVIAFLMVLATAPDASAQDGTVVDAGPLLGLAVEILAPVVLTALAALSAWVLQRVGIRTGLKIDAGHRAAIEQALRHAVGYVATHLEDRAAGGIPINLRNEAIATAARYAGEAVPDALKYFRVTPERLSEMVEARLEGLLIDPSQERGETRAIRRMALPIAGS